MGTRQKQHVDYHRKTALRKRLLGSVSLAEYTMYVPFIGDGDIASDLYKEATIYGADIEWERVTTALERLPQAKIIRADCNRFPFPDEGPFDMADFDAYSDPYEAFRSFWSVAKKADRLTLFFTDGHKQGIMRTGWVHYPDGRKEHIQPLNERRKLFNFYFPRIIMPWFTEYVKPYRITQKGFYLRGMMLYWGAVIENV